jgi:hypothetical protein
MERDRGVSRDRERVSRFACVRGEVRLRQGHGGQLPREMRAEVGEPSGSEIQEWSPVLGDWAKIVRQPARGRAILRLIGGKCLKMLDIRRLTRNCPGSIIAES